MPGERDEPDDIRIRLRLGGMRDGEGTGLGTIDSRRVPQIFWHERKSADNFPPRHHPGHSSDHKTRVTRQSENLLEEC